MKKIVILSVAMLCAFAASASSARAAVYAGVLKNTTHITITYQVKVNNGAWITHTLRPGQSLAYSFPSPGATLHLRYDNRLGDGRVTVTNTTIVMHGCDRPGNGWLQRFILVNDGRTLVVVR